MNRKKMLKLIAGLVGLMILFPPITTIRNFNNWGQIVTKTTNEYSFLFNLPSNSSLNVPTLLIQIFGALLVGGLAYVSIGKD